VSNIVPMQWNAQLPEHLRVASDAADMATLGAAFESRAFARVSTKDNTFALVSLEGELMRVNQMDPADAKVFIDVVFIKWSPTITKAWYEGAYVDGSDASPACFSMDGVTPDASSTNRQATACASCPKNAFGSAANGSGKACADRQRTAVILGADTPVSVNGASATLKAGKDVYGFALAPMTGKNLNAKVKEATKMGVNLKGVVMRAKFVSQGVVDFQFLSYLGAPEYAHTVKLAATDEAIRACGLNDLPARPALPAPPVHAQLAPPAQVVQPPAPLIPQAASAPLSFPLAAAPAPVAAEPSKRRRGRPAADAQTAATPPTATAFAAPTTIPAPTAPLAAFPSSPPAQNGVIQQPAAASSDLDALLAQAMA